MTFWIKAAQLLLSLSILVVLHEFGHYLTARYFKIRVEKFYLFFNPWFSLFKKKIGETEWGIGWLPLGGFVKISGMIDESMDKEQMAQPPQPWEFRSKPAWQRLIVMIGGVVVNIIVGVLIYIIVFFAWGKQMAPTADLQNGLSIHPYLAKYDIHSGDNILKIDGEKVMHYNDITNGLLLRDQRTLTVQRPTGETVDINMPEGIDFELFEQGALPVVQLRHKSVDVEYLITTGEYASERTGLKQSDFILSINDKSLEEIDFNDDAFMSGSSFELMIQRGLDSIRSTINKADLDSLLNIAPAMRAGVRPGDVFLTIADQEITFFDDITSTLYNAKNSTVPAQVLRDQDTISLELAVTEMGSIGFAPKSVIPEDNDIFYREYYSFGASLSLGVGEGMQKLSDYISQLKFLFTKKGAQSIGGFGAIGQMFPPFWDWEAFWLTTAFISIILAFMNILPIPALDGGHVIFLLYEMITGKEAPQKVLEYAQYVGFFLLIGLVLYANGNDLYRWLTGG